MTIEHDRHFISVGDLAAALQSGQPLRILDIRFDPGKGSAKSRYLDGHIPGAIYVDLPTELAGPKKATGGNLPLPSKDVFEQAAQRWGLADDSDVVVYDDSNGAPAARAAWLLRWVGLGRVRLLDGGFSNWRRAQLPVSTKDEVASVGTFKAATGNVTPLSADDIASHGGQLIDARPEKAFAEGHIPGAINLPSSLLVDDDGLLLSAAELARRLQSRGIALDTPIAAYCGGGVASSFTVAALATLGQQISLYPGSWSDWISDASRPIEK
jgi:thiosulfate/3-mercaptopyruvate sulfurtransferase